MKKKLWGVLVAMLAFLFIAGCGVQKKASAKTAKPEERIQTINYQSLTKDEKKDIEFKFKATNDSYGYAIDMIVKNDTDKNVKFNLSSFMMMDSKDPDFQINSSLKKKITLKSEDEIKVDKLFENLSKSDLERSGSYYYLNKNYRLAYLKDTTGLTEQTVDSNQATTQTASSSASVSVAPSTMQKSDSSSGYAPVKTSTAQQSSSASGQNIITNSEQAVELYKHSMAMAGRNDIAAKPVSGGFNVYSNTDSSISGFIAYDGNISVDGDVTPYSQAAKQTYNDQPGDEQFDPTRY
ncbi:hypothetical protein [Companilactobacillus jidongensis]|uniref:hypothetical protein n=1 Tax=Companilactobacillus jidongensis TaxID=2486006 RepID=UPI000F77E2C3|nr:hypothetical protein [Companilactobacillus jidongensis]